MPRRTVMALGAALLAAYAYFYQAGGWNQNSRFALVRAILEQGTLRIDDTMRFDNHPITGDFATYDGHFYSDKAPGLALIAAAPVALARPFVARPASRAGIAWLSYWATVMTAGLPTVIAALLVFRLGLVLGATAGASAFAAAVFGLGSPAWCYATLFYGHALSTACLVAAFTGALALGEPGSPRRDWWLASVVGIGGGWATVTEFPAAVPAAIIALLAILCARSGGPDRVLRVSSGVTAGALACAAVLGLFNELTFGAPFTLGYSKESGFEGMAHGFFGLTYPKRGALTDLLFGEFRGLFQLAPVLAVAPIGFAFLLRGRSSRMAGAVAAAIVIYYVLFNASYYYWDGGWSFGPRHMAPALPFMSLAIAPLWSRARLWLRTILCVLALYGAGVTFVAVATTAQPPDSYRRPVRELLWPSFSTGRLSINWQSFVEDNLQERREPASHAWNVGEKLGMTGLTSLAPLLAIWTAIGLAWWSAGRKV